MSVRACVRGGASQGGREGGREGERAIAKVLNAKTVCVCLREC